MANKLGHANTATYTGRELRQLDSPLLAGATSARPLGSRSGVRPGTSTTTASATATVWTVQPFSGIIDFVTAAEAGAYPFAFDAAQTGAVTAAAGSARIDILYVEGNDPAESAGTPLGVSVKYLAGTAGSGVPPTTPARSFVIALINVPASGGGSPTVTWTAPYCAASGAAVWVVDTTRRDAMTWADGDLIWLMSRRAFQVRKASSSEWVTIDTESQVYTPTWTSSGTAPTLGNSTLTGSYVLQGKRVFGSLLFTVGTSGVSGGTGTWRFSLPFTPSARMGLASGIVLSNGVGRAPIAGEIQASTAYVDNLITASQTIEAMSLAANSVLRITFDYDLP